MQTALRERATSGVLPRGTSGVPWSEAPTASGRQDLCIRAPSCDTLAASCGSRAAPVGYQLCAAHTGAHLLPQVRGALAGRRRAHPAPPPGQARLQRTSAVKVNITSTEHASRPACETACAHQSPVGPRATGAADSGGAHSEHSTIQVAAGRGSEAHAASTLEQRPARRTHPHRSTHPSC